MDLAHKAAKEKIEFISAHREKLIEAWIAETGLLPSESILMQQDIGGVTRVWIEKKPDDLPPANSPVILSPED
jgi:hypothetical protein